MVLPVDDFSKLSIAPKNLLYTDNKLRANLQFALDVLAPPFSTACCQPSDDIMKAHLIVPEGMLSKNKKPIKKLTFWFTPSGYVRDMKEDKNSPKARVRLHYIDGSKEAFGFPLMFPIDAGVTHVLRFFNNLVLAGATAECPFFYQSDRNVADWTKVLADDTSQKKETAEFYQLSRTKVAELFVSTLHERADFLEKAQNHGLQLFSFGCGNGEDVQAVKNALIKEYGLTAESFGCDINPNNFGEVQNVLLETADLSNLDAYVPQRAREKTLKLGLFWGSLTYMVCKSTYSALQSLHNVKDFDVVLVGGYTPPVIDKSICKAAGWQVSLLETNGKFDEDPSKKFFENKEAKTIQTDRRATYTLMPMSDTYRLRYLEQRGIKRSSRGIFDCLDISCSAKPLRDLSLFEKIARLKQVDISWCCFSGDELRSFISQLEDKIEEPIFLIASGDEPWYSSFTQIKSEKFKLKMRQDHKKDELAPFAPGTAKKIGVFSSLPCIDATIDQL